MKNLWESSKLFCTEVFKDKFNYIIFGPSVVGLIMTLYNWITDSTEYPWEVVGFYLTFPVLFLTGLLFLLSILAFVVRVYDFFKDLLTKS